MLVQSLVSESFATSRVNLPIVVPLILACLSLVLAIPAGASRGKLHIPAYSGLAVLAFATALLVGRLAKAHGIAGSTAGRVLAIAFFLLIAMTLGSILALFFYRHPSRS